MYWYSLLSSEVSEEFVKGKVITSFICIILNDLETFLEENKCFGINLEISTDNISIFIKLFV